MQVYYSQVDVVRFGVLKNTTNVCLDGKEQVLVEMVHTDG